MCVAQIKNFIQVRIAASSSKSRGLKPTLLFTFGGFGKDLVGDKGQITYLASIRPTNQKMFSAGNFFYPSNWRRDRGKASWIPWGIYRVFYFILFNSCSYCSCNLPGVVGKSAEPPHWLQAFWATQRTEFSRAWRQEFDRLFSFTKF